VSSDDEVTLRGGERYYDSFSDQNADERGTLETMETADDDRPFGISSDPGPSRHRSEFRGERDRRTAFEDDHSFQRPELSDFGRNVRHAVVDGLVSLSHARAENSAIFQTALPSSEGTAAEARAIGSAAAPRAATDAAAVMQAVTDAAALLQAALGTAAALQAGIGSAAAPQAARGSATEPRTAVGTAAAPQHRPPQDAQCLQYTGLQYGSRAAVAVARQLMSTGEQLPPSVDNATAPQAADPALAEAEPRYWTARQAEAAALAAERCSRMDSAQHTDTATRNSLGRIPNALSVHAMPNMAFSSCNELGKNGTYTVPSDATRTATQH